METQPKKICANCKQEKNIIDFAKNISAKGGLSCYCIECFHVKHSESCTRFRIKNLELVRKRRRESKFKKYHENPERFKKIDKVYREKNKELLLRKNRVYRKNMATGYILQIIKTGTDLKRKDIPTGLIEVWRLNLTLKRLKKEKAKCWKALKQ